MSSNDPQQYIDPSNLAMLRGVLAAVGFEGSEANVDSESKEGAARFIVTEFQHGNNTRQNLISVLRRRGEDSTGQFQTPQQSKNQAVDRWDDDEGQVAC